MAKPIKRPFAQLAWQALLRTELQRYQFVLGPRRVGKTTVMYQTVQRLLEQGIPSGNLWWLRLDHPLFMSLNLGDLAKFLLDSTTNIGYDTPIYFFLDELVYMDDWALWLKAFYDDFKPIRVMATSSATAAIQRSHVESGVGRWEVQYLSTYLFTEYLDLCGKTVDVNVASTLAGTIQNAVKNVRLSPDIERERRRFLLIGGFPELLTTKPTSDETSDLLRSQNVLRNDAIERAVYKDIPQAFGVQDPLKLERLLYTLAGQMTGQLSPQKLATDLGFNVTTLDRYLSFLQQSFIVFTLPNYAGSEETVQRRGRKIYFVDGAVRNAALLRGLSPLTDLSEMGVLLENAVAAHMHALSRQSGVRVYHWRQHPHEVDLIYDDPNGPLAFEVASSPTHHTRALIEFQERFPIFRNRCYLVCPGIQPIQPEQHGGVGRLPLDLLLIAAGAQAYKALEGRFA
jgi:hypothetical protein